MTGSRFERLRWAHSMLGGRFCIALIVGVVAASTTSALAATIDDFFGVYVGTSEVMADGEPSEHRDLDMEIVEASSDAFIVRLIVVTLVDGRRDLPGVERRYREIKFRQDGDGWEIDMRQSLFSERREMDLERGDEVMRAHIEGESLVISSEYIQSSGEHVNQIFDFRLIDTGLETRFTRKVDGTITRETLGRLVRVD